jgi:hypothetical protein
MRASPRNHAWRNQEHVMSARNFHNAGSVDRWLRAIVGLAVLSLAFVGPKSAWGYLGLIPLATAALGFCPLYSVFGISTCKHEVTQ